MKLATMRLLSLCLIAAALPAAAATIPIYSTGLAGPGEIDPNWTVLDGPSYVTELPRPPFWSSSTLPDSGWISPQPSYASGQLDTGNFWFTTSFDLTGLDPDTAEIDFSVLFSGQFLAFSLNGAYTGFTSGPAAPGLSSGGQVLRSGFIEGINEIEFSTAVFGAPVGINFRVNSATADAAAATVPEPTSVALFGIGVALLTLSRFRRRR